MINKDVVEKLQSSIDKVASSVEDLAIMMKKGFDEIHEKFATKEEMNKGFERFATKEDMEKGFKKFATKEDMKKGFKKFATREEIFEKFATREEVFEKFATKDDMNDKFDKVFGILDTIVHKLDKREVEGFANISAHDRINRDLFRLKKHTGLKTMEVVEPLEQ